MVVEILEQVLEACGRVQQRFLPIREASDFTNTPDGMEKLDAICMVIVAIGESLKKIDKITNNQLLPNYPQVDWKGAKGMRDIISHHYFDIDAEEIYWVCSRQIEPLVQTIKKILSDLQS
ncbi:MAG: DUF86 domain-containing protein [Desulfobulbaceae bacterium]|nr:DUF86 domain-containing protein [Desulfobulbaceae bacterium]